MQSSECRTPEINRKKKLRRRIILVASATLILILFIWGFALKTEHYEISSDKIDGKIKIVFISDLHNCFFGGTDQSGLMDRINEEKPDMVIFGGDMIDLYGGTDYALEIMSQAAESYPCCYTPGNHEYERDDTEAFKKAVSDIGVNVLEGDSQSFTLNNNKVEVFGVLDSFTYGDKATQLDECIGKINHDSYNILVAHQPEQIEDYLLGDFNLVLSGHSHGGQWRLPFILEQGLYSPDQGLFPDYTCGRYDYKSGNSVHIISRGLAKPLRMIFIPRIFNRPEFSVIEID